MNRIRILFFLIALYSYLGAQADTAALKELYKQIDTAIEQHDVYIEKKSARIAKYKKNIELAKDWLGRYRETWNLYKEYTSFNNDSAIAMLNSCISLAGGAGDKELLADSYIALVSQYAISGAYSEGEVYLKRIDGTQLTGNRKITYLLAAEHLYGEMGYYTQDKALRKIYYDKSISYRDSCYLIMDHTSAEYMKERVQQLTNDNKLDEAKKICDSWMSSVDEDTHDYAIMAFFRSEIYKKLGDKEQRKHWLAVSALCDIHNAIMDQASLWSLAEILGQEGDLGRSNRYVEFSWECTQRFNAHLRSWTVSPVLSMISSSYQKQLNAVNSRLIWLTVFISLLVIGLFAALIYVSKKRRQLAVVRNELKTAIADLSQTNSRLSDLNAQLSVVNSRLIESNHVKDEYIGEFFSTCSAYIDKLDNYRIKINRKLRLNQTADLMKLTGTGQLKEDEHKLLLANFDKTFLRLFPTFVEDFNKLLKEDARIMPTQENTLTKDLRIFALIRLGIEESSRIAEFLNYSPNSIYNYRARIKSKAICGRDEFERKVRMIGTPNGMPQSDVSA